MSRNLAPSVVVLALATLLWACSREAADDTYRPGLGEIMTLTQMRHAKLWLAGEAGNWPLAEYEIHELEEGFEDVVKFHAKHRRSQVPLAQALPIMMEPPLEAVRAAVAKRDRAEFTVAFDALTKGCNDCHRQTNFAFNVVTRPSANPYVNQNFAPPN
jgi:hypothetical protein